MKRIALTLTAAFLISGCVSEKSQHLRFNDVQSFLNDPRMTYKTNGVYVYPPNHWQLDRDMLNRLNDRNLLLEQQ